MTGLQRPTIPCKENNKDPGKQPTVFSVDKPSSPCSEKSEQVCLNVKSMYIVPPPIKYFQSVHYEFVSQVKL